MGNMVTFTCRKCGHEQNILWGAGLFSYNDEEFADDIKDPEMSREIRLILQQDGAVVESIMESGYYCPLCYIWHDFLYFSIVTEHLVHTPIYQCENVIILYSLCHLKIMLIILEMPKMQFLQRRNNLSLSLVLKFRYMGITCT